MNERISPTRVIKGVVNVPGDKSISHRYAMLAGIAEGETSVYNFSTGADCQSTLACMGKLGVEHAFVEEEGRRVLKVQGVGTRGLKESNSVLDAGNSGSTIRMLSGILSAQPFKTVITGDESLVQRPMRRVITPLTQMGARIDARDGQFAPLTIHGGSLHGIEYHSPVASAQVKSCILLAGLFAQGETIVHEPVRTRDHTEIALAELGAEILITGRTVRIEGGGRLTGKPLFVPGDLSSAAFFIVAALIVAEGDLTISNIGLNPTRAGLLDILRGMGANIKLLHIEQANGELIGTIQVRSSKLAGGVIEGAITAGLIDEIPILAVLGAVTRNGLIVKDCGELRVKETDRIATISASLERMGVSVKTTEDSIEIPGGQKLHGAVLPSGGDHRIAMAFSIAALIADGPSTIEDSEAASVSFPEFFQTLNQIAS